MKDLIQWAVYSDSGQNIGWVVMGVLMLSLVWMHLMWFFKRPIWKKMSDSVVLAVYICTVGFVTLLALLMTGIVNLAENNHPGNPILILYMFIAAPVIIITVLICGYQELLKVREKIPEA